MAAANVLTVVAARYASRRLPGKALEDIDGETMLRRVVGRAERIGYPVVVACPVEDLWRFAREGWDLFGGDHHNVLRRLNGVARAYDADHLIRVTADCPLLDPEAARFTVMCHLETGADFTHYIAEGRAVEVFTREALERSERESRGNGAEYREHPDEWILRHSGRFRIHQVKFSVDTPDDLELVRRFQVWQS